MPEGLPNIVLLISHDLGQHCGCYGAGVETPSIDAVAAGGALFTNYHCTAAQCSPSRGSIMTGLYPHNNGLVGLAHLGWEFAPGVQTLPMHLARAGYSTHLFGLQHETAGDPRSLGYQHVGPRGKAVPTAQALADWLRADGAGGDDPFFLCLGTPEPHRPYGGPGYRSDDPDEVQLLPWLPDRPGIRQDIAELNGLVRAYDEAVGIVDAALEETGRWEDTVFIVTTDHGLAMPRAKCTCYDPGTKTTLAMRFPGHFDGGAVHDELLTNCDLMPTLLELAGQAPPEGIDGRSFLGLLSGEAYEARDHIFTEMTYHGVYNPMRCVRTRDFKYIRNFGDLPTVSMPVDILEGPGGAEMVDEYRVHPRPEEELFDLRTDPFEMNNLVTDKRYCGIIEELRGRVDDWMRDSDDPLLKGYWPSNPAHTADIRKRFAEEERFVKWREFYTDYQLEFTR